MTSTEIHPLIRKELHPVEFDIPVAATASGELNLSWIAGSGQPGRRTGNTDSRGVVNQKMNGK
jgi:hypothetical protein